VLATSTCCHCEVSHVAQWVWRRLNTAQTLWSGVVVTHVSLGQEDRCPQKTSRVAIKMQILVASATGRLHGHLLLVESRRNSNRFDVLVHDHNERYALFYHEVETIDFVSSFIRLLSFPTLPFTHFFIHPSVFSCVLFINPTFVFLLPISTVARACVCTCVCTHAAHSLIYIYTNSFQVAREWRQIKTYAWMRFYTSN